jgi:AraC-like DNA-binding protein
MLSETTNLAAVAFLLADTLQEEYGLDPAPMLAECLIDPDLEAKPGSRISTEAMSKLWKQALQLTGDSTLGIKVGRRATLGTYYVLGYAWYASASLVDAIGRLLRYHHVIDTSESILALEKQGDSYRVSEGYANIDLKPPGYQMDAEIAGFLKLCELVKGKAVYPTKVELVESEDRHPVEYQELFQAPIVFGAEEYALYFDAAVLEEPLATAIPDVADATDKIAKRYVDSLDKNKIAGQVRELLIQMLPSGSADQENIASKLYRSSSTLQRQLTAEGTNYRDVLETTRSQLAEEYLKNNEHTHAQVAYLLGFSDQSNFARAFKRWTGQSPGQYQKALA